MKTVADTLGVSRSNLVEQAKKRPLESPATRRPYTKAEDVVVLPVIRRLVDQRPTYGYRRITALLNRGRRAQDLPPVNAKRVLRIMQVNGLVLTRLSPGPHHDGVVIALRSNIRWCSDHLELKCRNGEIVRVLFVIDACDRRDPRLVGRRPRRRVGRDGARSDGRGRREALWRNENAASCRMAVRQR